MKTITAIEAQRKSGKRDNIFLNGSFAFSLTQSVVKEQKLAPGQILTDAEIEVLLGVDLLKKCCDYALRLLSYRPRSETEIRARLVRRFDRQTVEQVIHHLKAEKFLDDTAFAIFWKGSRQSFSPRSKRMLSTELRSKGIDPEVVSETLKGIDDGDNAYRVAQKKVRTMPKDDYKTFRRKLGAMLSRRGFSYDVVDHTVDRVWQEL
jgi:regulatory protein